VSGVEWSGGKWETKTHNLTKLNSVDDDMVRGDKEGQCNVENCCPNECSNSGDCKSGAGTAVDTCECDWFFDGSSCNQWSSVAAATVAAGVGMLVLLVVSIWYFNYLNKRKREVVTNALDELR